MEKKARAVLAGTALLLAAMLVWAWANRAPEAVQVNMKRVERQDIYNSVTAPGTVEAIQSMAVAPTSNAVVTAVYVRVGDTVSEGDTLCTLQSNSGIGADSAALTALWRAAMQSGGEIVVSSNRNALTAPCAGTILALPETGQVVYQSMPCAAVANLSRLQVRVQVPELFAQEIEQGQKANITAAAVDDMTFAGRVESVAPVAVKTISLTGDTGASTVEAILLLRGKVDGLRPGYRVNAKIFTDYHPNAVVVPYEAIRQQGEQQIVFTVQDGKAQAVPIETGYMLETVCEVTSGLKAGETIILTPPDELQAGDAVTGVLA